MELGRASRERHVDPVAVAGTTVSAKIAVASSRISRPL